jgi:hypothetical protein
MDPTVKLYKDGSTAAWAIPVAGFLGVVATLISIAVAVWLVWPQPLQQSVQASLFLMAGIWGVGGPMWFFSEYFFFYRKSGVAGTWEQFKHGQQVSAAIWAGLSVSLAALGTSDLAKGPKTDWTCDLMAKDAGTAASSPTGQFTLVNCRRATG